ncbi:MAG: hypothetical protein AB7P03_04590 [Kofleriaceae bacterium]
MSFAQRITLIAVIAACGSPPPLGAPGPAPARGSIAARPVHDRTSDPDLEHPPRAPLLSIDWTKVPLHTDADALAVWRTIAPTGKDFEDKLDEIPVAYGVPLAIALLHEGKFLCTPPRASSDCVEELLDVADPAVTADLDDPCLRRILALWSIAQLEPADVPRVIDSLRAIAALPAPESQLVAAAIDAVPETEPALRLELLSIAWRSGHHDLASSKLGDLDEPYLIEAVQKHHIEGAIEVLSADAHRAAFLAAIRDEALGERARSHAISEMLEASADAKLTNDLRSALVAATRSSDCRVAAQAARALALKGDPRYLPRRPRTRSTTVMMRALCVLASYEQLQGSDEDSLLPGFVPAKGLEQVKTSFDPLGDVDQDGDGDPHTDRETTLIEREAVVMPEIEEVVRAFARCNGAVCTTRDREIRFSFKTANGQLWLSRIELADRPPCPQ